MVWTLSEIKIVAQLSGDLFGGIISCDLFDGIIHKCDLFGDIIPCDLLGGKK